MKTTIKVNGDEYEVEPKDGSYVLHGKRGATYKLLRNKNTPEALFAVNAKQWGLALPGAWFTDRGGKLEVR